MQRFVDLFGHDREGLARQMLGATLVGICSQRLLPAARAGMVLNAEVLINSARVRDRVVGGGAPGELCKAIAEGDYYGMNTFDQRLVTLVREGVVKRPTRSTTPATATTSSCCSSAPVALRWPRRSGHRSGRRR